MEPLPKIARERLRAGHVAEHPDADLLTAFAEQALTSIERSQVADHLSHCSDCRHVVALVTESRPPLDDTRSAATSIRLVRGRLLSWSVLRWGALAACVVVVSAAGLLLTQRSFRSPEKIASTPQPQIPAEVDTHPSKRPLASAAQNSTVELKRQSPQPPSKSDVVAQSKLPGPVENRKKFLTLPDQRSDKQSAGLLALFPGVTDKVVPEKPSQSPAAMALPHAESMQVSPDSAALSRGQTVANAAPAPSEQKEVPQAAAKEEQPQRIPAASETVEVTAEAPTIQTQSAGMMAKRAQSKLKTGRLDNKAVVGSTADNELAATAAITSGNRLMRDVNAAQWTLSSDGVPQRSFDSGKTWETVQVDHRKTFRALSAQGMDVWVGGLAGVLYHSSDVGLHWTRIIPVAENSALTADILTIDFRDPLHGTLTTANRESWITSDAGKTWQKE
jgi:Photosynthesis system II assembly factor YCF48/Putative zinc-finger